MTSHGNDMRINIVKCLPLWEMNINRQTHQFHFKTK